MFPLPATRIRSQEIWSLLNGPSLFSPVVKTLVIQRDDAPLAISYLGRESAMRRIEERFRFLSCDVSSIIGRPPPSYRETLLRIHRRMQLSCPRTLPTADLESEVFLHLLQVRREKFLVMEVHTLL